MLEKDYSQTSREIILDELTQLKVSILQNLMRYGRNATGNTGRSLRVQLNPDGGTLFGRSFFTTLEVGRGPTVNPVPHNPTLHDRIVEWMQAKGVHADDGNDISLSWAITNKIHKLGTKMFRERTYQDIYSTAVEAAIKNTNARLIEAAKTEIQNIHLHFSKEKYE